MTLELTQEEHGFLVGMLTNVVPNMQVQAKDAAMILAMCDSLVNKLNPKGE